MELEEFLRQTQTEIRAEVNLGDSSPYAELVFTEKVMQHMSEVGMTFDDPCICHYSARIGNANLRLSGYAISEESDQIDLFVSLYSGVDMPTPVPDQETRTAAAQCLRFLAKCAEGRLASRMDASDDAYGLAHTIQECYPKLDQIRIYVLTDRQAKAKNFKSREVSGRTVKLEVMDIERLHRHWSEGKPRDEILVNFEEVCGMALPGIYIPDEQAGYNYALTVLPGEALRFVYEKYGARLLEANVRSFLSATGKVNRGIRDTLMGNPERFMAYNNGIVVTADEIGLGRSSDGTPGILWIRGMQIVNGGQTTASIYFTKKKNPEVDLSRVRVPAKIIELRSMDAATEEILISDISKYANSQNVVRQADLSANKPFHVEIEKLANTTYCPDGISRWFYERAAGSYNVMLVREGTTPARLQKIRESIPPARKITKTDLAKFLNAWDQKPHVVSFGAQKNFIEFMQSLEERQGQAPVEIPDITFYKQMIAKAILFKNAQKLARELKIPAFQANVATYLISLTANRIGDRLNLDRIWQQQDLSGQLKQQLRVWASEVHDFLHQSAKGRMISEWAKKLECWEFIRRANCSEVATGIPELF